MSEELSRSDLRELVAERAQGCCEYCRSPARFASDPFSVEHVIPRCRGGGDSLDNLALSCQGCNNHKFTKTTGLDPETGKQVPLFNPRTDRWVDHFRWSVDAVQIVGLTPTGRATIEELQLNRDGVVNLRRLLYLQGPHPAAGVASQRSDLGRPPPEH